MIVSTLFIKELWTLFPESTELNKLFPYSDTLITKQTYVWFLCFYAIQLIIVHVWYVKFTGYHLIFGVWFGFQLLEVFEFLLCYNEAQYWFFIEGKKFNVNVINAKYITIFILSIRKFLWKK